MGECDIFFLRNIIKRRADNDARRLFQKAEHQHKTALQFAFENAAL